MKKLIAIAVSCICIAVLVVLAIKFGTGEETVENTNKVYRFDSDLSTDIQTISNGTISLDFDPMTGQFVFTDKNGKEWYSNPQGPDAKLRKELQASIVMIYKDKTGIDTNLNSYAHSVEKGNYSYEVVDDTTIRVDYTVGQIEKTYFIPIAIPYERYEAILANVSDEGKKEMKSAYRIYDIDNLYAYDDKDALLKKYPDLANNKVVALRDDTQEWKKEEIEKYMIEAGYTEEDYEADLEIYSSEVKVDKPAVNVSLYLKLDGEDLVVSVPYDSIEYMNDYPITEIRVLPYLCAAGMDEEGFLFVPDGSGALIDFNNMKYNQSCYSAKIYGWDYAAVREELINDPLVRFPVYGISYTDQQKSMLCVVEDGDSYGYIEADVAGRRHKFNYVTSAFTVIHNEVADVSGKSDKGVYLFEEGTQEGEGITIRYKALASDGYVEMAKAYRNYLLEKYPNLANGVEDKLPTAIELIGAITKTQQVLGFPKDLPYALTTYNEMSSILKQLSDAGMTDMDVVLNGWFNGGVQHEVASDVDLISKLGSKKDFKNLLSQIENMNSDVYLKADFTFVYKNGWFDSFQVKNDVAKFLSREVVEMQQISNIWYGTLTNSAYYYLAKPAFIMDTLDSFVKDIDKLGTKNVAFASIGNILSADYNRKNLVSREAAKAMQAAKLKAMTEDGSNVLIYKGNEYAVPYADIVLNMPVNSDNPSIVDHVIPFFAIALHGYVEYTGDAINLTGDYVTNLLKSVESGAGLYYIFMDADTSELQDSAYTEYFGANFAAWKDDAVAMYERFNKDFAGLYQQSIENHEIVAENVTMTEYANGTKVYVNYRASAYTTEDGVEIAPRDWTVVAGKGGN